MSKFTAIDLVAKHVAYDVNSSKTRLISSMESHIQSLKDALEVLKETGYTSPCLMSNLANLATVQAAYIVAQGKEEALNSVIAYQALESEKV